MNANPTLKLDAATAAELMAPNPISLRADASIHEALALLTDKGLSAVPVIDDAGRPIGVLSSSDLLVHGRQKADQVTSSPADFYEQDSKTLHGKPRPGVQVENVDPTTVRDVMTPAVFAVGPTTPAAKVVNDLIGLHVHRLFVVDDDGVLVGVISTMDVLKRLRP